MHIQLIHVSCHSRCITASSAHQATHAIQPRGGGRQRKPGGMGSRGPWTAATGEQRGEQHLDWEPGGCVWPAGHWLYSPAVWDKVTLKLYPEWQYSKGSTQPSHAFDLLSCLTHCSVLHKSLTPPNKRKKYTKNTNVTSIPQIWLILQGHKWLSPTPTSPPGLQSEESLTHINKPLDASFMVVKHVPLQSLFAGVSN